MNLQSLTDTLNMLKLEKNFSNITKSNSARETGNSLYKSGQLFAALAQYNKALVLAADDQEQASLCYGNRSAVYLKLQYFAHCLHNIDLAEPHFPREKIQKLHDRREECQKMMKKCEDKAMKQFEHASKLSYEPNPKIPFFIDALEIKDDLMNGKHVITTQALKAGDVIGIVNPWQVPIDYPSSDYKLACYNCFDMNNGDLIPGKFGVELQHLFCSEKCRDEHMNDKDHEGIHELEELHEMQLDVDPSVRGATDLMFAQKVLLKIHDSFGSVERMRTFVYNHKNPKYNFFDFDWSIGEDDPKYHENMLLIIMSSRSRIRGGVKLSDFFEDLEPDESKSRLVRIYHEQNSQNRKFIDKLITQMLFTGKTRMRVNPIVSRNCVFAVSRHPAFDVFSSSESCDPNIILHHENQSGPKRLVMTVIKPISAGDKINFRGSLYFRKEKCNKTITCLPCRERWADMIDEPKLHYDIEIHSMTFFQRNNPKKVSSVLKHREKLCNLINKNFSADYYKDPKARQMIATKMEELRMNLNYMGNPMPAAGRFLGFEFRANDRSYLLPNSANPIVNVPVFL